MALALTALWTCKLTRVKSRVTRSWWLVGEVDAYNSVWISIILETNWPLFLINPSKQGPFRTKTRVIWVPGRYVQVVIIILFLGVISIDYNYSQVRARLMWPFQGRFLLRYTKNSNDIWMIFQANRSWCSLFDVFGKSEVTWTQIRTNGDLKAMDCQSVNLTKHPSKNARTNTYRKETIFLINS